MSKLTLEDISNLFRSEVKPLIDRIEALENSGVVIVNDPDYSEPSILPANAVFASDDKPTCKGKKLDGSPCTQVFLVKGSEFCRLHQGQDSTTVNGKAERVSKRKQALAGLKVEYTVDLPKSLGLRNLKVGETRFVSADKATKKRVNKSFNNAVYEHAAYDKATRIVTWQRGDGRMITYNHATGAITRIS